MNVVLDGGIPLDSNLDYQPRQLLDGGNDMLDYNRHCSMRRNEYRQRDCHHELLRRDGLLQIIKEKDLRRPTPVAWRR
jgi:hypothetical protein